MRGNQFKIWLREFWKLRWDIFSLSWFLLKKVKKTVKGLVWASKDSNEILRFRFMSMLDLAGSSTKEAKRQLGWNGFCMGHKAFLHAQWREGEREGGPRLLRRGYCTLGTSYPSHQLPEILARAFSERIPEREARTPFAKSAFAAAR